MSRLVSRAQLARQLPERSQAQVYRDCEKTGPLVPAMVGKKVDLDHKAARVYCAEHNYEEPDITAITREARKGAKRSIAPAVPVPPPNPETDGEGLAADDYLDMTLRELVATYGTQPQFKEYVAAAKTLVQMRGLEDDQERKRGNLIHRVIAEKLIAHIDGLQKALLSDAVANMTNTAMVMTRAGNPKREIEQAMQSVISRTIKSVKAQSERDLRDA